MSGIKAEMIRAIIAAAEYKDETTDGRVFVSGYADVMAENILAVMGLSGKVPS